MTIEWLNVGKLVNTHGLRGEVKILSQTDFPDVRFAPDSKLAIHAPDNSRVVSLTVHSAREHKGMFIVKWKGMDHIDDVEQYKGWSVKVDKTNTVDLDEDEYYYHEIIGCRVVTEEGEELGEITEILSPGANDVWVVEQPKVKPLLLPVIDEVVIKVDIAQQLVTVRLMEGLV